jgi:hypothetical protein
LSDRRFPALGDAAIYAGSAAVAGGVALFASIPLYREAGRIAFGPYAVGAAVALGLALRRAGHGARLALAGLVLAGALVLPLALETVWRANTSPGLHAQSEAIITEEAAKAVVRGDDPYVATYLRGPLSARPLGTKTHFPYLPGMLVFGMPRALGGTHALTDARVSFAVVTLIVVALMAWRWRDQRGRSIRLIQVMAVIPTAALLLVAGGDDVPVAALMVLALLLASDGKPGWAGVVAGLAAAMKQTAWVLLPFLVLGLWRSEGRRAALRSMAASLAVALPVVLPFVVWSPSAFVEDAIRFPLGLGRQPSAAGTPTLGALLVHAMPSARTPLTLVLGVVVLVVALYLRVVRPPATVRGAAARAAVVFVVAIALAPASRIGYIVYPIDLLAWAWLARGGAYRQPRSVIEPAPAGTAVVSTG